MHGGGPTVVPGIPLKPEYVQVSFPDVQQTIQLGARGIITQKLMSFRKLIGRVKRIKLTPWLMEPGGSMPHSQGLSNNSYPEPNQPNYPH